jgi:putative IMPACT (imprinted ancient) family translation regulator
LREMQKANLLNGIVVVVRYYGGVKLEGDRFRHVMDASKMIIQKIS